MTLLSYDIFSLSPPEKDQNYNFSVGNIKVNSREHFWQPGTPSSEVTLEVKFPEAFIQKIKIQIKVCWLVYITLYNLSDDGKKIKQKQLEKMNFLGDEAEIVKENDNKEPTTYEYAEFTFKPRDQLLQVYFLGIYGTYSRSSQAKLETLPFQQQIQASASRISQFNKDKFINKAPAGPIMLQRPNLALSDPKKPAFLKSQEKGQLIESTFFKTETHSSLKAVQRQPQRNSVNETQYQQAIQASLQTFELEKKRPKIEADLKERESNQQLFDKIANSDAIPTEKDCSEPNKFASRLIISNPPRQAPIPPQQCPQKTLFEYGVKRNQLFQSSLKKPLIQVQDVSEVQDLDCEQMTSFNEKHLSRDFVDYHRTLEQSHFRSYSLFQFMNENFLPFRNLKFFINKESITDYEYMQLKIKIRNYGGEVLDVVSQEVSYIISEEKLDLSTHKFNTQIVSRKFIDECSPKKLQKPEKYLVK